jgi:hypothetical protein
VVRKVIRSEATEYRYEREARPLPRIGHWIDKLDRLLVANEGKAPRERLTLIRLFDESLGFAALVEALSGRSNSPPRCENGSGRNCLIQNYRIHPTRPLTTGGWQSKISRQTSLKALSSG